MVLSDSRRTPQLVESSHRHGTSGIWLHTKPDHLCTTMNTQSRMDRIITLNCSSECPHLTSVPLLPSRLSYLLSWGRMQYTRLLDSWLNSGMTWVTPEWNLFTNIETHTWRHRWRHRTNPIHTHTMSLSTNHISYRAGTWMDARYLNSMCTTSSYD